MVTSLKCACFILLVLSSLMMGSCKDESSAPAPQGVVLEVLKGDKQVDTVGHIAHDYVQVRLTRNGKPVSNYTIRYEATSCYPDLYGTAPYLAPDGRAQFRWRLSAQEGLQTLRISALDSVGKERVATTISAMAVRPTGGWHPAACLPSAAIQLCQLPEGRILAGVRQGYLHASDDNGATWQPLPGPDAESYVYKIVSLGGREVMVGSTAKAGGKANIYYSPDNGATWQLRSNSLMTTYDSGQDLFYTKAGKLLASTNKGYLFGSNDKGRTWEPIDLPFPASGPNYLMTQAPNGTLYFLGSRGMVRSKDGGTTWDYFSSPFHNQSSLYIDPATGYLYAGSVKGEILRSTDQATTWQSIYQETSAAVYSDLDVWGMFKANGAFYFSIRGLGLIRTTEFKSVTYLTRYSRGINWGVTALPGEASLVTASGALLTSGSRDFVEGYTSTYYNLRP